MWTLRELINHSVGTKINDCKWAPCRPINHTCRSLKERIKEAYLVFIGKADCFIWPEKR